MLDLVKGLDFEEAALSWAGAAVLWWGRESFVVRHGKLAWRALLALFAAFLASAVFAAGAVWLGSGRSAEPAQVTRNVVDLFAWNHGSVVFRDELAWLPLAVGAFGLAVIIVGGRTRSSARSHRRADCRRVPRAPPRTSSSARTEATRSLLQAARRHAATSSAPTSGRSSATGSRAASSSWRATRSGPADALPQLVREACALCGGARPRARSARRERVARCRSGATAGLRALYFGDEAIVETRSFSLEGRAIRKVRQSVSRVEKAGYAAECAELARLDAATWPSSSASRARGAQARPSAASRWRWTHSRRRTGTRASSSSRATGRALSRGFLHFVPTFGRPAVSLSFMRRERDTPNGLTEFLVVTGDRVLRERGIEELSLNFAAFGRLLHAPSGRLERARPRRLARQPLLPDGEPVPLQREVLAALGAAVSHVRADPGAAESRARRDGGGGPAPAHAASRLTGHLRERLLAS